MSTCIQCGKHIDEWTSKTISIDGDMVCKNGPCEQNNKKQNTAISNMTDAEFNVWMYGRRY